MGKGWHAEPKRHSLARRGIKSVKPQAPSNKKTSQVDAAMNNPKMSRTSRRFLEWKQAKAKYKMLHDKEPKKGLNLEQLQSLNRQKMKSMTYDQLKNKGVDINSKGDADGDGVKNSKDCRPLNKNAQDDGIENIPTNQPTEEEIARLQEKALKSEKLTEEETLFTKYGELTDKQGTYSRGQEAEYGVKSLLGAESADERQKEKRTLEKRIETKKLRGEISELKARDKLTKAQQKNLVLKENLLRIRIKKENAIIKKQIKTEKPPGIFSLKPRK